MDEQTENGYQYTYTYDGGSQAKAINIPNRYTGAVNIPTLE